MHLNYWQRWPQLRIAQRHRDRDVKRLTADRLLSASNWLRWALGTKASNRTALAFLISIQSSCHKYVQVIWPMCIRREINSLLSTQCRISIVFHSFLLNQWWLLEFNANQKQIHCSNRNVTNSVICFSCEFRPKSVQNKLNAPLKMHAINYYLYILYAVHTIIRTHIHQALVNLLVTWFKLLLISTSNFVDCGRPQPMNGGRCCLCVSGANIAINKINLNELFCEKLMSASGGRCHISYLTAFIYY